MSRNETCAIWALLNQETLEDALHMEASQHQCWTQLHYVGADHR